MDVVHARLEYAESENQKMALRSELLKMYDQQIEIAELQTRAPSSAGGSAKAKLDAYSHVLLLRSERLRVQIEWDTLDSSHR